MSSLAQCTTVEDHPDWRLGGVYRPASPQGRLGEEKWVMKKDTIATPQYVWLQVHLHYFLTHICFGTHDACAWLQPTPTTVLHRSKADRVGSTFLSPK